MHLVQIFLPLYDNAGHSFPKDLYRRVRDELIRRHGGLTAYTRSPAHGLWQPDEASMKDAASGPETAVRDDLVIYEVMVERLDAETWGTYRAQLEKAFRQETILMRTHVVQML